jgi:DNA-nicking Smr family endonuclease
MKKRVLKPEERRIWAKVAATVTPRPGRAAPDAGPPEPPARRKVAPPPVKTRTEAPGLARFAAEAARGGPQDRSGERRVRRGQVEIDARLDLHGMTQIQARAALAAFLARLRSRGGRGALVITGKGRPGAEGVLRRRLPEWLAQPDLAALSAGYAPAHARHGGEGAWYVFVRRRDGLSS